MSIALRPFLPADAALLIAIFREAVVELTVDDYDEEQRDAWAGAAEDEVAFANRLSEALTIIATIEAQPVGFISLKDNRVIDLLYVHPDAVGQGVAAALADAIEKIAAARGAKELTAEASDTARGFFEHRGYAAQTRNTVLINGEWLANTSMKKALPGNDNIPAPGNDTRH